MTRQSPSPNNGNVNQCPVCGQFNHPQDVSCSNCGTRLRVPDGQRSISHISVDELFGDEPELLQPRPRPAIAQQCPGCGELNRPGVLVCEACGTNLTTGERPTLTTRAVNLKDYEAYLNVPIEGSDTLNVEELEHTSRSGTSAFTPDMVLRIQVQGEPQPILLRFVEGHHLIFGRRDASTTDIDVDLSAYSGYQMGISRHHAAMELADRRLEVWDLQSSNGTYLNGMRLEPYQRHQLRDNDELRMGRMVLNLLFQHKIKR